MNPDLHMAGDLKNTGKGNLFVVFGEPDIDIEHESDGRIKVRVKGVDVYDPNTGEIRSNDTKGIAAWFVDTAYNEESFFVRHVYFLGANDPYKSLKTALQADIDREAWETLYRAESRPLREALDGQDRGEGDQPLLGRSDEGVQGLIGGTVLENQKQTIRQIVGVLNNREADGGFWLPNIQRHFVWSEGQICRLFDSIMREYPVGTMLTWKTDLPIRRRKFICNWNNSLKIGSFYIQENTSKKYLILDGQQRLQSFYIGLCGSFEGRELYFDVLSGELAEPNDVRYKFQILFLKDAVFPNVKVKELVFTTRRKWEVMAQIETYSKTTFDTTKKNRIDENITQIDRVFKMDEAIVYQVLDSIDNPNSYSENDVVDVFIRANSGGTRLEKSDLLFSLLNATWDVADKEMEELLETLNSFDFQLDRDFVLKTSLVLINQGARYDVTKFRKKGVRKEIEDSWEKISIAIKDVLDFVREQTFIRCDKALPSYLVLIPLIFLRYNYPSAWTKAKDVDTYLLTCLFAGAFGGQPDNLIDALIKKMSEIEEFSISESFNVIKNQGRQLGVTEEQLWTMGYGSKNIHLIMNVIYTFNYVPAYVNNLPQIDHIFPHSLLREIKKTNTETGRPVMKY